MCVQTLRGLKKKSRRHFPTEPCPSRVTLGHRAAARRRFVSISGKGQAGFTALCVQHLQSPLSLFLCLPHLHTHTLKSSSWPQLWGTALPFTGRRCIRKAAQGANSCRMTITRHVVTLLQRQPEAFPAIMEMFCLSVPSSRVGIGHMWLRGM